MYTHCLCIELVVKWKYIHTLTVPASTIVYMNVVNNCVPMLSTIVYHMQWYVHTSPGDRMLTRV